MNEYMLKLVRLMLIVLPGYLLLRRPWQRCNRREWAMGVFILFTCSLLMLALEGEYTHPAQMVRAARERIFTGEGINLMPFYTISTFFRFTSWEDFLVNIVGNVVMFIPWGFGLVLMWKKNRNPWKVLLLCLMLPLGIEFIQLFIDRRVDVDDLILNFTGGVIGAGLWTFLRRCFPILDTFAK